MGQRMEIYTQTFIAYEGFVELKTKFLIDCFTNYTGWIWIDNWMHQRRYKHKQCQIFIHQYIKVTILLDVYYKLEALICDMT